jgi:hypothetical protein
MAKIITENFKVETSNELFNSFKNINSTLSANFLSSLQAYNTNNLLGLSADNNTAIQEFVDDQLQILRPESHYYIMASSVDKNGSIQNTQKEKRDFQRRVIFGNKITDADVRYMFYKNNWTSGTIYDDFDDEEDVTLMNTVVTVPDDEGNYLVFKCLENNKGSASTVTPSLSGINPASYEFITQPDKYIWKYMFTVSSSEAAIYQTTDSLPLPYPAYGDAQVIAAASESVSQIIIEETPANQFNAYLFGAATDSTNCSDVIVFSAVQNDGIKNLVVTITAKVGFSLYTSANAYANMYLKTPNGLYEVLSSAPETPDRISIAVRTTDSITPTTVCQLVPKINVSQSTLTGTPCKAYGIIDQFGTLTGVGFHTLISGAGDTKGTEYKFATAEIAYPGSLTNPGTTILRCVVSPRGGHGSNPIAELAMSRLAIITNFSGESATIPDSNTYTKVGLMKNPTFSDGLYPDSFDNRTTITVAGNRANVALPNYYIQQYIKTVVVNALSVGTTYVITSLGDTTQTQWNVAAGTSGVIYVIGNTFTASAVAIGTGTVSTYRLAPAVDATLDPGDEILSAKIHESVYDSGSDTTTIYLVDYYGNFENTFQKGTIYVKSSLAQTTATTLSINNASTDVVYGKYTPYTGELLHYVDFDPITRQLERKEKIKFIFDF